jgi:hypothetical protein
VNALEAAVSAARAHGVRVDEPRVLKTSHNLVVHLAPSPVVARIAQWMDELRPNIRAYELALTHWLVERGLPVLAPVVDEVLVAGGYDVTLWPLVANERPVDGRAAGRALRAVDDALREYPGELRGFWPLAEMRELGARIDVRPVVEEVLARVERELRYEPVALHGDAHFRNCYFTAGGVLWADLEDACLAPPEWDAACMEFPQRLDGRDPEYDAALAQLDIPDRDRLELLVLLRAAVSVSWSLYAYGRSERVDEMAEWLRRNAS